MLPLEAFGSDRAQPAGLSYRCRDCDRAKSAAYYATPGAFLVRIDRELVRGAVIAACGGACWGCGTGEALSVYRAGVRLSFDALRPLADGLASGDIDEDDVADTNGPLVVSCSGCAPTSAANTTALVERLLQRLTGRLVPRPPSLPRTA